MDQRIERLQGRIRDVPDFPKPGIIFKDWTPVLSDHATLQDAVSLLAEPFRGEPIDYVVGMEARGFLLGVPLAMELDAGFVPVRKPGKLPSATHAVQYELEYGTDTLEMHVDAFSEGERILIVDDLLATGGTAGATVDLIERARGEVVACAFLIELDFLEGRKNLRTDRVVSVLHY